MSPRLSLADVAMVLDYGKQLKTAQKLCGKLKEGGLVSV
jgi:transcription initiation factor TFIIE subunit alpha